MCSCKVPTKVYNGVCGKCLSPLDNSPRNESGALLEPYVDWNTIKKQELRDRKHKPKGKK